jgi:3'-phosphoadenosine 5'-phosphosulfate sulfotransferase (PAPS reductase)/FAD synthetase
MRCEAADSCTNEAEYRVTSGQVVKPHVCCGVCKQVWDRMALVVTPLRHALPMARTHGVETTPEVDALLADGAPVGIGVSGGKDSTAVAFATTDHLDQIHHTGPRLLVHADLGVTEWADSLPVCEKLAARLGLELLVVRRPQGDMMDRWEQRWRDNVKRWVELSCVKLILPWSTPDMRFCTSEMKIDQITRGLSRKFPGTTILNVTGIRRSESNERRKAVTAKRQPKLENKTRATAGWDWNAIAHWELEDVLAIGDERGFARHEGYTKYGSRRISCVY